MNLIKIVEELLEIIKIQEQQIQLLCKRVDILEHKTVNKNEFTEITQFVKELLNNGK